MVRTRSGGWALKTALFTRDQHRGMFLMQREESGIPGPALNPTRPQAPRGSGMPAPPRERAGRSFPDHLTRLCPERSGWRCLPAAGPRVFLARLLSPTPPRTLLPVYTRASQPRTPRATRLVSPKGLFLFLKRAPPCSALRGPLTVPSGPAASELGAPRAPPPPRAHRPRSPSGGSARGGPPTPPRALCPRSRETRRCPEAALSQ